MEKMRIDFVFMSVIISSGRPFIERVLYMYSNVANACLFVGVDSELA